jgi:murein DD-endopeptidase MepM/ murein hydrolase activator NlpD
MKKLLLPFLPLFVVVCLVGDTSTRASTAATTTTTTTSQLGNISTRGFVQTGNNVMIGGFIIEGTQPKRVIVRAMGPELTPFGITNALADPTLELHDSTHTLPIASNDNWQTTQIGGIITGDQVSAIQNSGHVPTNPAESAIIATLQPGSYTAIVSGTNNSTGVALVEVYDLSPDSTSILGNISTRGLVQTSNSVMIGGFIIEGTQPKTVIVRAMGPELTPFGITNALADPTLELHDSTHTLPIASNDNWQTTEIGGIITSDQVSAIQNSGLAPSHASESAIIATLPPGNYTAIVRGTNSSTGVALVEVYDLDPITFEQVSGLISASQGGVITLPSGSSVSMPGGMFATDQSVMFSLLSSSPTIQQDYSDSTIIFGSGPAANYVAVVDTGFAAPQAVMSVSLNVPDDLLNSLGQGYAPYVFVKVFSQSDEETQDAFEPVSSQFDPVTKTLTASVPNGGFTNLRNQQGTYESVFLIGSLPTANTNTPSFPLSDLTASTADVCQSPVMFYSPILGLNTEQLSSRITSHFVDIRCLQGEPCRPHVGIDIAPTNDPNSKQIVAAASGYIYAIGWSHSTGQTVVIQHQNGTSEIRSAYHHLVSCSIHLLDSNRQEVDYPTASICGVSHDYPERTLPWKFFAKNESEATTEHPFVPVTGGETNIGIMGNTGTEAKGMHGGDGTHLHFEIAPGDVITRLSSNEGGRINPEPCITLSTTGTPSIVISSVVSTIIDHNSLWTDYSVTVHGTTTGTPYQYSYQAGWGNFGIIDNTLSSNPENWSFTFTYTQFAGPPTIIPIWAEEYDGSGSLVASDYQNITLSY